MELQRRERDAQVAVADYQVYALATIHGIDAKVLDSKMKLLSGLRQNMIEIINHQAYDPQLHKRKAEKQKQDQKRNADLMNKVANLGK